MYVRTNVYISRKLKQKKQEETHGTSMGLTDGCKNMCEETGLPKKKLKRGKRRAGELIMQGKQKQEGNQGESGIQKQK